MGGVGAGSAGAGFVPFLLGRLEEALMGERGGAQSRELPNRMR